MHRFPEEFKENWLPPRKRQCSTNKISNGMFLLEIFCSLVSVLHIRCSLVSFLELFFNQVVVDGSVSSTVLKGLMSLTEYQIAVFAIYAHTASEGLRGTETTRMYWSLPHVWPCTTMLRWPFLSWISVQVVLRASWLRVLGHGCDALCWSMLYICPVYRCYIWRRLL